MNTIENTSADKNVKRRLPNELTGMALAYLGDCVIELMVREYLIGLGMYDSASLNKNALRFVKATAQSVAFSKIEGLLEPEELAYFKRGRNANVKTPKSATVSEYHRATGFEALFGYLELTEKNERKRELFNLAYADVINSLESDN